MSNNKTFPFQYSEKQRTLEFKRKKLNVRTKKEKNTKPGESPQVWRFQFAEGGEGGAALVLGPVGLT